MDKDYFRYKKIIKTKAKETFWIHFKGLRGIFETIFIAILSGTFAIVTIVLSEGKVTVSAASIVVISVVGGPLIYLFAMYVAEYTFAHFRVFTVKENEADKLNWNKVSIDITRYAKPNIHDMAIKITTKKPFPIMGFQAFVRSIEYDKTITRYPELSTLPFILDREYKYITWDLTQENPAYIALAKTESIGGTGVRVEIPKESKPGNTRNELFYMDDDDINPEMFVEVVFSGKIDIWLLPDITKIYRVAIVNGALVTEPYEANKEKEK